MNRVNAEGENDFSMLVRTLRETDRRLEEMTQGQVDSVVDREGRSYMLQSGQQRRRQSDFDRQAAVLDALPAHIALLDSEGVIASVNGAWRRFASGNALQDAEQGVGRNYLEICEAAAAQGVTEAAQAAAGIRAVLGGLADRFSMEYACESPSKIFSFLLTVTPIDDTPPTGAVVMHLDISERKRGDEENRRFTLAMDAAQDGIFLIDRHDMRFVHANEAACRMHGLKRDEVLALQPWEVLGNSREQLEQVYDRLIEGGGFAEAEEALWQRDNGPPLWIEVRRHALRVGGRWTIVVAVRDVTARKEAEFKIGYLNRVHAVLSGINTLIVRVRNEDELFRESCRIAVDHGALAMAWIGKLDPATGRVRLVASADMEEAILTAVTARLDASSIDAPGNSLSTRVVKEMKEFVSNDSQHDAGVALGDLHERFGINSVAMLPLVVADEPSGVFVMFAREKGFFDAEQLRLLRELAGDVAFAVEQIGKQERLDYLAYYDVLTGLANRTLFLERVAQYLRNPVNGGRKLALCLIDLERFKNINDSLGRTTGDSLLRQTANWLINHTGDAHIVARIDADRFAVIMPAVTDEEEVARRLERTVKAFQSHSFYLDGTAYRMAIRIGVAVHPDDGGDADTLFKHAEAALKKAKAAGDRYLFYALKMTESVVVRLNLENQLRRALEFDEFVLHYQPKIELASGKLAGAEALIRWNDPLSGMVAPGRFIPILEETGLIHEVGRWALNKAMQDYLRWRGAGLPAVRIAVNLSPLQLRNRHFTDEMQQIIGVDANVAEGLELEITESLIMEDVKRSIASLNAIRAMGVRIAIDDFGTGFSSLSYLSRLPVDTLKIDRSFVEGMSAGAEGLSLVSVIINLAHSLHLRVVAEGVETEAQLRSLESLDCDEIQGFLCGKPLAAAAFEEQYLASSGWCLHGVPGLGRPGHPSHGAAGMAEP